MQIFGILSNFVKVAHLLIPRLIVTLSMKQLNGIILD